MEACPHSKLAESVVDGVLHFSCALCGATRTHGEVEWVPEPALPARHWDLALRVVEDGEVLDFVVFARRMTTGLSGLPAYKLSLWAIGFEGGQWVTLDEQQRRACLKQALGIVSPVGMSVDILQELQGIRWLFQSRVVTHDDGVRKRVVHRWSRG